MPAARPRKPSRRDTTNLFEMSASIFAMLPPWAPLLAVALGDAAVIVAFTALHWNTRFLALALMVVTGFFALSGVAGVIERAKRRRRLANANSLNALRALSWQEFEHLVLAAYAKEGWSASLTQHGADGGADIILERSGAKVLVQCKQWRTRQIGAPTIRELHSVVVTEKATSGVVVTCGTFSREAQLIGQSVGIECMDGSGLLGLVTQTRGGQRVVAESLRGSTADTPACPRCASAMVQRRGSRGLFWGCSTYPRCRGSINISRET